MREIKRPSPELLRQGATACAQLLGCVAVTAVLSAPVAAERALEAASVDTTVVGFPTKLSFRPDVTELNILQTGSAYIPRAKHGIGLNAEVYGIPRFETAKDVTSFFSPAHLAQYSSLAESPHEAVSGYEISLIDHAEDLFWRYDLIGASLAGVAVFGALKYRHLRHRLAVAEGSASADPTKKTAAALAAITFAGSTAVAGVNFHEWHNSQPIPANTVAISALDATSLAGTVSDNPELARNLQRGIPYAIKLSESRTQQRIEYVDTVRPQLLAQIDALPEPRENEELILVVSDIHASKAGIELINLFIKTYQAKFGQDSLRIVLNLGDTAYDPKSQRQAILDQGHMLPDGIVIGTPGNHDVKESVALMKEGGMEVPDGRADYDNFSVYSKADPMQTPFGEPSYFPDPDKNEFNLGTEAYESIKNNPVDAVDLHEPYALAATLTIDNLRKFLEAPVSRYDLTTCPTDTVGDIPARLLAAGHWHDQLPIRTVCNSDGTWTVIDVQGTAGGASPNSVYNSWNDVNGRPVKDIQFRSFYRNKDTGLITGALEPTFTTSAYVEPLYRTDIGTPDGQPFNISSAVARHKFRDK